MATDTTPANSGYEPELVVPQGLQELMAPQGPNSSLGYATPTAPGLVAGGVDLGSGYTVGLLQALQIIVTTLSAITADIGTLVIEEGGSLSSGETAFGVGAGFWLGTDASGNPQISIQDTEGNFINIQASGSNVLSISSSGISGALTSKQIDDAGIGNTAVWLDVSSTPTTLAGYNITDAQAMLPNAAGVGQVLQRDNSGAPYFSVKYDGFLNSGAMTQSGTQNFTTNVAVLLGKVLDMGQPPAGANILFQLHALLQGSGGTPNATIALQYSTDSGSTWTTADTDVYTTAAVGVDITFKGFVTNLNPTGNLQIRATITNSSGANTVQVRDTMVWCLVIPNANYTVVTGTLSSVIPATGSGNCTASYPATTCKASLNVTVTPGGGVPPYTYLWSVVSGTGTITAGATSQTCTVSDTETATSGGATHNTVVACSVTDSQDYTGCTASESGTTATVTTPSPHGIPVGGTFTASSFSVSGYNGNFTAVTGTTGSTLKYTTTSGLGNATGGVINNVKVVSGNDTITNTFTLGYSAITATVSPSSGSCSNQTCGNTCTANGSATANASGGNGSYTYSWSVVSGTGTIVSGSTSQTVNIHDTQATSQFPYTHSSTVMQCSVNDTRGTGAVTPQGTVGLTFRCPNT